MRIEIPVKMVSENTALRCIVRGKYASPTKSEKIKEFENQVLANLLPYMDKFAEFINELNPERYGVKLSVINRTPKLFTKKGTINHNSIDVDNIKYLVDSICKAAHFNDSQVLELHSFKEYADDYSIVIFLNKVEF
jgi:Holliday junction resolvase RusA-like endonuclease